ncbi:MAG: SDR family NAD(P)-dependent oxidoreductase [Clostridia bacterium]|nr:SDR family NAD(P)-dependent oxidoreductase [Clostridia bacterium]
MREELHKYTMITGATGVLGGAFVRAALQNGERLILTGRSEEKLRMLKERLLTEKPDADIKIYAADLSNEGSRGAMTEKISAEGLLIGRLINVAGADVQKGVKDYTEEKLVFQCRVNFEAAASLCRFAYERRAKGLEIINISSVSGIYPMPYFALYSATKGALTSFSVAFREEVRREGVKVTAVLPGAIPTREDIKAQIKGQGLWGRLAAKSPEFVVKKSLKALAKNRAKLIPGFWNKVMNATTKFVPAGLRTRFIAKRWSKISKDAF